MGILAACLELPDAPEMVFKITSRRQLPFAAQLDFFADLPMIPQSYPAE